MKFPSLVSVAAAKRQAEQMESAMTRRRHNDGVPPSKPKERPFEKSPVHQDTEKEKQEQERARNGWWEP